MIIAKRLRIIYKTGKVFEYTHVIAIATLGEAVIISGERDEREMRKNVTDTHLIKKVLTMNVDFHIPLLEVK